MTDVKQYRAGTTLEALEMVKRDLGAEAFVLGTKAVRSGGFLGFGTKSQIEISATSSSSIEKPLHKPAKTDAFRSRSILNLTDAEPAAPLPPSAINSYKREKLISVLSARTARTDELPALEVPDITVGDIQVVEVTTRAPRIIHTNREMPIEPVSEPAAPAPAEVPELQPAAALKGELDLLRAEMREVKFSLGAFANRQHAGSQWQNEIDLDVFTQTFDGPLHNVYGELIAAGVSSELARKFIADSIPFYDSRSADCDQLARETLLRGLASVIKFEPGAFLNDQPVIMAVIGATGVGKTTTIAKLAAHVALYQRKKVELVTLDTYRIAAVEQLKSYAEIIGAGCQVVRSVFELDAVLRRLPSDATVLIDTTGRSPHDLADQYEVSDYLAQRGEIRKCLAVQATTHCADAAVAIKKFAMYGADCLVLTKIDETIRPGAVLETIAESNLPLAYLCAGQRVPEDLQIATAENLTSRILGRSLTSNTLRAAA